MVYDSGELPQYLAEYNLKVQPPKEHHERSFNVAPTAICPVYRRQDNVLKYMKWGLVPHWVKDVSKFKTFRTFNAREESLQTTRMWVQNCNYKRCVVPMNGYYEWRTKGRNKTPFYVTRKDGKLMFLAGMYDHVEKDDLWTFTIITGKAPESLKWLHDRMPVVLEPGSAAWDAWLGDQTEWNQQELDKVLATTYEENKMRCYQVNNDVGKTAINEEYLTKPIFKQDKNEEQMNNDATEDHRGVKKEEYQGFEKEQEKKENLASRKGNQGLKKEHQGDSIKREKDDDETSVPRRAKRNVAEMLSSQKRKKQHR